MNHDCCCPTLSCSGMCGCCDGVNVATPMATANRPGLPALSYRVGTHGTFLESMKARLSSSDYPQLAALTTRAPEDAVIGMLDAWATVADVLTFYQERIANEGYLRTATERRSVVELGRLVGYEPRPGVASSVYLAYTLDDNFKEETVIAKGTRAQSVPGPGELPQSFETSEELKARAKWNNLKPRTTKPQTEESVRNGDGTNAQIYLNGIVTNLKLNDPLLIDFSGNNNPEIFRVRNVILDGVANRTLVTLQESSAIAGIHAVTTPTHKNTGLSLVDELAFPPSVQLASGLQLPRDVDSLFTGNGLVAKNTTAALRATGSRRQYLMGGEASYGALKALSPSLRETLSKATESAEVTNKNPMKVYALRTKASLFGHNAPKEPLYEDAMIGPAGHSLPNPKAGNLKPQKEWKEWDAGSDERGDVLYLDRRYENILPGSHIAILKANQSPMILIANEVHNLSRSAYGISGESTRVHLNDSWWDAKGLINEDLRITTVFAQPEELEMAEEPITEAICGGVTQLLELDGLYEGLESGRWVVVSGEREIGGTSGVRFSELAMLASVTQGVGTQVSNSAGTGIGSLSGGANSPIRILAGDKTRTFIKLGTELAYCFKRDTVSIYGNIVRATHGETRREALGSGDGAKALQAFILKQPPLTHTSASNPTGIESSLKVYVNDIQWREAESLALHARTDRVYVTKTDDEGKTKVIFGNGKEGARLPTGIENIKAEYRNGIGKSGNVKAGQISLLSSRPLGVKEVINPLRALGGADRDSRDQARKNVPIAIQALDRLVSVQDYEDFSRTYAGIGKARAVELSDGGRQVVQITIAGNDDIPIDKNADLYKNLRRALLDFGDPYQAIQLEIRELMLIVVSARIRIHAEYQWEPVVTQMRSTMLDAFGFERRELGQDVSFSEVISVMQGVRGVAYVDVDVLRGIPEKVEGGPTGRRLQTPAEIAERVSGPLRDNKGNILNVKEPLMRISVSLAERDSNGAILPAQLAFISPDVPETLILNQII
jgi:Baseplate J-like protein